MAPGEIYRLEAFYLNAESGELEVKYVLLLAVPDNADIVARLLTSRQPDDLAKDIRRNKARHVFTVTRVFPLAALECAAAADDTTVHQERHLRNALASLR